MALFSRSKKEETEDEVKISAPLAVVSGVSQGLAHVLKNPRITEKATMQQGAGIYAFDVAESASKRDIIQAVRALYKFTPRKVAIVTIPRKARRNMRTGTRGVARGGKKAYVYLKKGETISIA